MEEKIQKVLPQVGFRWFVVIAVTAVVSRANVTMVPPRVACQLAA